MSATGSTWLELLQSRTGKRAPAERATRGELWLALVVVLVASAVPIGRALVDGGRLFFAVDTATAQAPWTRPEAATKVGETPQPVRNSNETGRVSVDGRAPDPRLVEQGAELYPSYRFTAEELSAQRLPEWNPWIGAGVPWLANPRAGVLDPQVLVLSALEIVGGRGLFDRGLAWMAWLRIAAAAFGAYVIARRLGSTPVAAAVSAAGYAGAGVCLAWVNLPAGHVAAVVPWLFVALDRLHERATLRGAALVASATALLLLGGDPESAFFAGLAGLAWAAFVLHGRARALGVAGLALGTAACAPLLVPFVETLQRSQAFVERRALVEAMSRFDFVSIGLIVVTIGLVAAWRALEPDDKTGARGLAGTIGVVFALCACAFVLAGRGLGTAGRALFLYDAHGSPATGWHGAGSFIDDVIAWVPAAVVALALASFCSNVGPLRARKVVQVVALCALLLAIGAPGAVDLWHRVPFFGLGSPARAAAVSCLFLALLAGEALDSAPRVARRTAGLAFVALVTLPLVARPAPPKMVAEPNERYFACTEAPPPVWGKDDAAVVGFVADELRCDALTLRAEPVEGDSTTLRAPAMSLPLQLAPSLDGKRVFRSDPLDIARFAPGTWRFSIDVQKRRADGTLERIGTRDVAYSNVAHEARMSAASMAFTMFSFFVLLFLAGSRSPWRWLVVLLVASQPLLMARGLLPSVPRDQQFDLSQTERLVHTQIGAHRLLAGPTVFPGDTTLLQRIPSARGSNALGPAAFDTFRSRALKPGAEHADPLHGWNAANVDTSSNAFRLLGVSLLALTSGGDFPGFELVACPDADCAMRAETFLYRALDPLPRAFCVTRIAARADVGAIDPLHEAFLEEGEGWRPGAPAMNARAQMSDRSGDRLRLTAEADGDALVVLTDAAFPGWIARVDGVEQRVLTVDGLFRGVPITKGQHVIELEYAPASVHIGLWIGLAALIAIATMMLVRGPKPAPSAVPP